MSKKAVLAVVMVMCMAVGFLAAGAKADMVPIRKGTVVSTVDSEGASYIQVKDDAGKEFYVITSLCVIADGADLEVLSGAKYENIRNEDLDKVFEEAYTAQLIRVNGKEIKGFSVHGLPKGCVNIPR